MKDGLPRVVVSVVAALAAVALLAAAGCQTGGGTADGWPSFRYRSCGADAPCPAGFDCESGHCVSEDRRFVMTTTGCESREDCGYGMACMESACVVDVLDCVSDFDCVGDRVCVRGSCVEESRCVSSNDQPCYLREPSRE